MMSVRGCAFVTQKKEGGDREAGFQVRLCGKEMDKQKTHEVLKIRTDGEFIALRLYKILRFDVIIV